MLGVALGIAGVTTVIVGACTGKTQACRDVVAICGTTCATFAIGIGIGRNIAVATAGLGVVIFAACTTVTVRRRVYVAAFCIMTGRIRVAAVASVAASGIGIT